MKANKSRIVLAAALALASVFALALQKDWTKFTTKDGSLSLSFPQGWVVGDPEDPTFKEALKKVNEKNPALAKNMSDRTATENQILLMFDTNDATEDGAIDNVNIIKQKSGGLTTKMYGDVAKSIASQFKTLGKMESKQIDLPVGKALTYWATMEINTANDVKMYVDVYGCMFLKGENLYIVSFASGKGEAKTKREGWEKILKTAKFS